MALISYSHAQQETKFQELTNVVKNKLIPFNDLEKSGFLTDCSYITSDQINNIKEKTQRYTQYIYNSVYVWTPIDTENGECILLRFPETRGLSREEAQVLLSAHKASFPVPQRIEAPSPQKYRQILDDQIDIPNSNDIEKDNHNDQINKNDEDSSVKNPPTPAAVGDNRVRLTNSAFPFYSVARVLVSPPYNRFSATPPATGGSAVQVSPYVFVTAAHVIRNSQSNYSSEKIDIYPSHNLLHTEMITASSKSYDSGYDAYASNDAHVYSHDIGFLRVAHPYDLPAYPTFFTIDEGRDDQFLTRAGNAFDPFLFKYQVGNFTTWYEYPALAIPVGYPS